MDIYIYGLTTVVGFTFLELKSFYESGSILIQVDSKFCKNFSAI